ncbi:ORFL72C [Human betaherpesvirus 5]|nr:ORFL72C [Human betaherpesvirus 5]QHX40380.1 ORFL72C [Human betaherpesvirus 5]
MRSRSSVALRARVLVKTLSSASSSAGVSSLLEGI